MAGPLDPRDPTADEAEVLDFVDRTGKEVAPLGPPGVWHAFGEGLGDATMQGLAKTGRAASMALAAPVVLAEENVNAARRLRGAPESTAATDWFFRNVVDDLASDAVDHWAPNAAHVGAAGQTLNGLATSLVPLAAGGGNPIPLLATTALDTPTELIREGAPLGTALGVGAIQTGATALGVHLPAAWGASLFTRLATGAGSNLAIGAASRELSARTLEQAGLQDLAEQYRGDASAAAIDVGMGLVFGGLAHAHAPRTPTRAEAAAILTAGNAHHFREGTTPGAAADTATAAAHVTAMETAVRQLLDGQDVDLAAVIPDAGMAFAPRGEAPPAAVADYDAFRHALESGGRADAASPTSSATGIDQFTAGTWRRTVAAAAPEWAQGLTDKQLLAARKDPAKSAEMERHLRAENAAALKAAGQPADTVNLYAAHHFGADAGVRFARAGDSEPMARILSAEQIKANPYLRGKTKGEAIANWTERARKAGVDVAQAPRPRSLPEVGQVIDDHIAELRARAQDGRLSDDEVTALVGEGNDLRALLRDQDAAEAGGVLPSSPEARLTPQERQFAMQRQAEIIGALERNRSARAFEGQLERVQRRLDRIDSDAALREFAATMVPEAPAPRAAPEVAADLRARFAQAAPLEAEAIPAAMIEAADRDAVARRPAVRREPEPPTRGEAEPAARGGEPAASAPTPRAEADAPRAARPAQRQPGAEPGAAEPRTADAGQPAPEDFTLAANDTLTEFPGLLVADEDGTVRPAAEVLAEAQAAAQAAELEAQAIDTAVACFLRSGT